MPSLDSVLKSRDVTLPTKVHIIKGMVFPVVMYSCESWATSRCPSILAWKIPWTQEMGGLQSVGSQRVGHN